MDGVRDDLALARHAGPLAVALVAVYLRQARAGGSLGLLALVGLVEFGSNMWFDGFAAPWIAEVTPDAFAAERTAVC